MSTGPLFIKPIILAHPQIPKPLHGLAPRALLGSDWWDEQRQKAYAKNNYHCWACGVHKEDAEYHQWLEAHECYRYNYTAGSATIIAIAALCHACHNYIHAGRMEHLVEAGKMSIPKMKWILSHGRRVLRGVDVSNNPFTEDSPDRFAAWDTWRLIIDGQEYPARFTSFEQWEQHYKGGNES